MARRVGDFQLQSPGEVRLLIAEHRHFLQRLAVQARAEAWWDHERAAGIARRKPETRQLVGRLVRVDPGVQQQGALTEAIRDDDAVDDRPGAHSQLDRHARPVAAEDKREL